MNASIRHCILIDSREIYTLGQKKDEIDKPRKQRVDMVFVCAESECKAKVMKTDECLKTKEMQLKVS